MTEKVFGFFLGGTEAKRSNVHDKFTYRYKTLSYSGVRDQVHELDPTDHETCLSYGDLFTNKMYDFRSSVSFVSSHGT